MCKISIPCPLCSHSTFATVASLRKSLIKVIDSPIKCPVCEDIVIGLDKLTLHLISHNGIINMTSNSNYDIINNENDNNINNNNDNDRIKNNSNDMNSNNNIINNDKNNNGNIENKINSNNVNNNNSNYVYNNINKLENTLTSLQQQQQQQLPILIHQPKEITSNNINQNTNETFNINTPTHAFYFKNEPFKFITPIILTPEFLNTTAMSTLASSSSSSSSSAQTSLTSESHMFQNLTQTNHSNHIQQQQQQQHQQQEQHQQHQLQQQHQYSQNIFGCGTTVLHLKQSADNNCPSNVFIIDNDNKFNNLIKIVENGNMVKDCSSNYDKIYMNTIPIIDEKTTKYSKDHRCDICGITFSSVDIFKKHVKIMHQIPLDTNDIIPTAKLIMNQPSNLETTTVQSSLYQCHLCPKSYKIKARLRLHLKVKHCVTIKDTTNATNNKCSDIANIDVKMEITNGRENKTNENQIKIETIDANNNLEDEQNGKIESIPKPWKCDICSKFYTTKYFLKKHKRIHTGETPYKCKICNKSFTFQQSYHKHLLYHSDDKPHVCKICNRAFKELSTLHNHERIHSGEKPFECEICGKRFRQRVSNYVHQRTHTGAKPYTCEFCCRKFRYKVTLRTHKCALHEAFLRNEKNNNDQNEMSNNNDSVASSQNSPKHYINLQTAATSTTNASENDNMNKIFETSNTLSNSNNISNIISNNLTSSDESEFHDINKERANKSLDELVAESCNKFGIGVTCNNIDINQNYHNSSSISLTNDTPSPSEQLQHLCLYSPNSIDENLNANLNINEDSLKQLLYEIEKSKHS